MFRPRGVFENEFDVFRFCAVGHEFGGVCLILSAWCLWFRGKAVLYWHRIRWLLGFEVAVYFNTRRRGNLHSVASMEKSPKAMSR